jgi:FMN reductase
MASGFRAQVRDESWRRYQHEYGSAGGKEVTIDLESDLMRLAQGGSLAASAPVTAVDPRGDEDG